MRNRDVNQYVSQKGDVVMEECETSPTKKAWKIFATSSLCPGKASHIALGTSHLV